MHRHIAAAILLFFLSASASEGRVHLEGWAGLAARYRTGRWTYVAVRARNIGRHVEGSFQVDVQPGPFQAGPTYSYTRPVSLPPQALQTHHIYFPMRSVASEVEAVLGGRGVSESLQLRVDPVFESDLLLCALGAERGSLSFMSGAQVQRPVGGMAAPYMGYGPTAYPTPSPVVRQGQVEVVYLEPGQLPDAWAGLDAADVIALGRVPLSNFPAPALEAIEAWVARGGVLVVTGGPETQRLRGSLIEQMLPVSLKGIVELPSLRGLEHMAGGVPEEGAVLVGDSSPKKGARVLARQAGVPLVVVGPHGLGWVFYFAFDFEGWPVKGWAGQQKVWRSVFQKATSVSHIVPADMGLFSAQTYGGPVRAYPYSYISTPAMAVLQMSQLEPPPVETLAGFLLAYLVVLVPANYYFLKKRDRLDMAWLTTPLIVAAFTIGAYFVGYALRGGHMLVNKLSILETNAGTSRASKTVLVGIFSPSRRSHSVGLEGAEVAAEVPVTPGGASRARMVFETAKATSAKFRSEMWSSRVLAFQTTDSVGEGMEGKLSAEGRRLTGEIVNETDFDLEECTVTVGRLGSASIGALGAGERKRVSANILPTGSTYPSSHYYLSQPARGLSRQEIRERIRVTAAEALLGGGAPTGQDEAIVVGWSSRQMARLVMSPRPRELDVSCFIFHLPCSVQGLPAGMPPAAVAIPGGTRFGALGWPGAGPGTRVAAYVKTFTGRKASLTGGALVHEAQVKIPAGVVLLQGEVEVEAYGAGFWVPELYSWAAKQWSTGLAHTVLSGAKRTQFPPEAHLKMPEGKVRMRVTHRKDRPQDRLWIRRIEVRITYRTP